MEPLLNSKVASGPPDRLGAPGRPPWILLLILAGAAWGYGHCLTRLPLTRAEALYALIPREMLSSGRWLTPTLQGVPYLDKPPLLYWLNALIYAGLGISDTTCRLLNLAAALGEIWLTWALGRELLPPRAALLGAGVLAGSLGFFVLHLQLLPDHLITLGLLGALWFWLRWLAAPSGLKAAGFFACLAGGFLSKGLIGWVFPVWIAALTAVGARRPEGVRLLGSPGGWLLAALPAGGWLLLLEGCHPGFLWHFLVNEQLLRFLGAREPLDVQGFSLPAFWLLSLVWLLPWTPLLPGAVAQSWRAAAASGPSRLAGTLLLLWPALILGFYSLSGCRVEYYALPALPALALMVGWRLERSLTLTWDALLPAALLLLAALTLLAGLSLPLWEALLTANRREFAGLTAALSPLLPGALPFLAGLCLGGMGLGWNRPPVAVAFLFGLAGALLAVSFVAVERLSPYLGDRGPGEWLRQQARPEDVLVLETVEEYEYAASLAWYAGMRVQVVVRGGLPRFPRPVAPESSYLLTPGELEGLWVSPRRVWVLADRAAPPQSPWQGLPPVATFPGRELYVNCRAGDGCRPEGNKLSYRETGDRRDPSIAGSGSSAGRSRPMSLPHDSAAR